MLETVVFLYGLRIIRILFDIFALIQFYKTKMISYLKKALSVLLLITTSIFILYATGSIKIEGYVKDQHGEPIIGASIIEKGTSNGTTTDYDGHFVIYVSKLPTTLVVSIIGYQSKEVTITSASQNNGFHNIIMIEDFEE